jgi:3-oxoacyl-[acyl-carrier-protein] synthase-3
MGSANGETIHLNTPSAKVKTPFKSKIAGLGSYLPERKLTNFDLERLVDTSNEWIVERTGIHSRRMAADGQLTTDLAFIAARKALEDAKLTADKIEMIIFATLTPDQVMPNSACYLQTKLGAGRCMAVDISAACTGFVYGLSIADQFIRTGVYQNILVVGAEILHNVVSYKDRETCILFGDGAGAAVVSRAHADETSELFSCHLHADGELSELLTLEIGGSKNPFSKKALDQDLQYVKMKGKEIFKHAIRTMASCCDEALTANDLKPEDIHWVIPHQANIRIIEAVAKHVGVPMDKVIVEIADMGNTSAATIPVAFDHAVRDGRIQRGQTILLTAFGGGITSGSLLLRY